MLNSFFYTPLGVVLLVCATAQIASAHVIVHPDSVGLAKTQLFTMGVPVEKGLSTTAMRLLIPTGVTAVMPNTKPGWTITTKKAGEGDAALVSEIDWTGGSVPSGQRDDFVFEAQVPAKATTLQWKAYQTFSDGSITSWDKAPNPANAKDDDDSITPYSQTAIVNDLVATPQPASNADLQSLQKHLSAVIFAISLAFGMLSLRIKRIR